MKRIRHTPRVSVAPCTMSGTVTGPALDGHARILTNQADIAAAQTALTRAYGLTRSLYFGFQNARRIIQRKPKVSLAYIAITPAS